MSLLFRRQSSVQLCTKVSPCRSGCSPPAREIDPFTVERDSIREETDSHAHREDALSTCFGSEVRAFDISRKLLPLKPLVWMWQSLGQTGVFYPEIYYSASKDIGPLLSKALEGLALWTCNADTCTLTVSRDCDRRRDRGPHRRRRIKRGGKPSQALCCDGFVLR